jgi:AmmeMemoRadiSam system protein A
LNAAFHDPRFSPLKKEELSAIKIEVSILSDSQEIEFTDEKELLSKIDDKMGLILKKGFSSATFLPQVWEEINNKKDFLQHLSVKAGLNKDVWKNSKIYFYRVKSIKE